MKLSNFRNYVINGDKHYADVDVTTGALFFKKTVMKTICKSGMFWFFIDNGEYTPDRQVENLCRAYLAQKDLPK